MSTLSVRVGLIGSLLGTLVAAAVWIVPGTTTAHSAGALNAPDERRMSVNISAPVGGEDVRPGSVYTVRWSSHNCGGTVTLQLWDGMRTEWSTIVSGIPVAAGEYAWHVAENMSGNRFRIRVVSDQSPALYWMSGDYFTVATSIREDQQSASVQDARRQAGAASEESVLRCFPSISSDMVRCEWSGTSAPVNISVWSLTGESIASFSPSGGSNAFSFSAGSWPSGMYTVVATFGDGKTAMSRMIVRH